MKQLSAPQETLRTELITSPNYYKYFLLFKLIAEHTTILTFIQLVESNDVMFLEEKQSKYKECLNMMMLICIKQHLSNI